MIEPDDANSYKPIELELVFDFSLTVMNILTGSDLATINFCTVATAIFSSCGISGDTVEIGSMTDIAPGYIRPETQGTFLFDDSKMDNVNHFSFTISTETVNDGDWLIPMVYCPEGDCESTLSRGAYVVLKVSYPCLSATLPTYTPLILTTDYPHLIENI